jgi:hypothetical protein
MSNYRREDFNRMLDEKVFKRKLDLVELEREAKLNKIKYIVRIIISISVPLLLLFILTCVAVAAFKWAF